MSEKEDEDDLTKQRAELDQGAMSLKEFAPVLWSFHESLVEQGFTRPEALHVVTRWFLHSIGTGR